MNIRDKGMWPEVEDVPVNNAGSWLTLLGLREKTFMGFAAREGEKGIVEVPVSLNTARGQDVVRLYAFRALEEYSEALDASDYDHVLEELIDSVNYWMSLLCLEDREWPFLTGFKWPVHFGHVRPSEHDLGKMAHKFMQVMDVFRNRSWMANPQDVYFAGYGQLNQAIEYALNLIASSFPDWPTFWRFYIAKDNVLQFRLRTNY